MSCKLREPEDAHQAQPLIWRTAGTASTAAPSAPAAKPAVDETEALRAQADLMRQQYEQRVREAHAAGVREGEATGRQRAAAEMQAAIERLSRSVDEISGMRARLRSEAEADLVRLALAIARRILRREIAIDPEALHGLILGALQKLQGQELTRVRVHPSHASAVSACLQKTWNAERIEVVADPSREIGAVLLETARGNLDASVESQLLEIERGLADRLRKQD